MGRCYRIFLIAQLIGFGTLATAQQSIPEEDISMTVLKWFYDHYPNAENAIWKQHETNNNMYKVAFSFEKQQYEATYDKKGKRRSDLVYLDIAPIDLTNFLYEQFDQFKYRKVAKKTIYPTGDVSYITTVKSKKEGIQELVLEENTISFTLVSQVAVSDQ